MPVHGNGQSRGKAPLVGCRSCKRSEHFELLRFSVRTTADKCESMRLSCRGLSALALECGDGNGVRLSAQRLVPAEASGRSLHGAMSGISVITVFTMRIDAVRIRQTQQAGGDRGKDLQPLHCSSFGIDRSAPRRCGIMCEWGNTWCTAQVQPCLCVCGLCWFERALLRHCRTHPEGYRRQLRASHDHMRPIDVPMTVTGAQEPTRGAIDEHEHSQCCV